MNGPRAWYSKRERMWVLTPTGRVPTVEHVWRDEAGETRLFMTAQEAYDAYAAEGRREGPTSP